MIHTLTENMGSLLLNREKIVSSFDVDNGVFSGNLTHLSSRCIINNSIDKIKINYSEIKKINVINGMGVTIGDSIVGICALDIIKSLNKNLNINVIRPKSCSLQVDLLYSLALHYKVIDKILYMPYDIKDTSKYDLNLDIGNHLYWPNFNVLEMHDFFLESLGVCSDTIDNKIKSNHWLQKTYKYKSLGNYVLFCPYASTPLRSIPRKFHWKIINYLYKRFNSLVVGFSDIDHPKYVNISHLSPSIYHYIGLIARAKYVYTCDSSALHIAAGFDTPTFCIFTSIKPQLRCKYYINCESTYIGNKSIEGMHMSNSDIHLQIVNSLFEGYYENL